FVINDLGHSQLGHSGTGDYFLEMCGLDGGKKGSEVAACPGECFKERGNSSVTPGHSRSWKELW
ncbi:unnamed protein product, partial [Allacma fusca]